MTDQPLMTFKSHTSGKNADVRIYVDRIEWDRKDLLSTGGKKVLGVATGGISLLKTGLQEASDSEVIPVKAISSIAVERDGFRQKVKIICSGNTIDFRCSKDEAGQVKKLVTDLMLGRHVSQSPPHERSAEDRQVDRPPPTSTPKPAGWYRDPGGKFDHRYFDGKWTDHVANEGDENTYIDPVPR